MENGLDLATVENYVKVVIPKIESELVSPDRSDSEKVELYTLYVQLMCLVAPYDFITFNKYLELDEDHNDPNKAFYHHRRKHLAPIFEAFNDMEIYNKYDMLLISTPPRVGKTTTGIRFLAWIGGRYPEYTQLATSYSDNITSSFYGGVMEVVMSPRYKEIFPHAPLVNQNSKKQEIWLKVFKRYPSLMFIPIEGSMTGRGDAKQYLYCDDLVKGLEMAVSPVRLEKLWDTYTVNAKQRKADGCKEVHIATRWSLRDPITKLSIDNEDNPRCKVITMPCYGEDGESAFDFFGGFSTQYYKELERTMEVASFNALYLCEPIEREGVLYHADDLQYFFELPSEPADTRIAICDSKNLGVDFVCAPIAYVYGDTCYIEDVVYNNGVPEVTRPLVAEALVRNKVVRADVELNNGGNYFAETLQELVKQRNGNTSLRIFYTRENKTVKIITYADYVVKNFVFKHPSTYSPNSEYAKFMKDLLSWSQTGKNNHDDAPDAVAMLASLMQDLSSPGLKILSRQKLGI